MWDNDEEEEEISLSNQDECRYISYLKRTVIYKLSRYFVKKNSFDFVSSQLV